MLNIEQDRTRRGRLALVTGAGGFLGRHVARHLAGAGWRVVGVGHGELAHGEMAAWGLSGWLAREVDLDALAQGVEVEGVPEVIFHGAGGASVARSWQEPLHDFERTVASTAVLIEFIRRCAEGARLIYPSSAAVYGASGEIPFREDAALEPVSPYGTHKLLAERLCLDAHRAFGLRCSVVRFFSLFGPGLRKQLLWDIARRLCGGEPVLKLDGDGGETRDFLYVEDAARLVAQLADLKGDPPLVVNGASGVPTSVREAAEASIAALGLDGRVEIAFSGLRRQGDPLHQVAGVERLAALGFRPEWSFQTGIERFAAWAEAEIRGTSGKGAVRTVSQ